MHLNYLGKSRCQCRDDNVLQGDWLYSKETPYAFCLPEQLRRKIKCQEESCGLPQVWDIVGNS